MRRSGQKERGFTLAELLIVVAIIAVLVAVSVPLFGNQLEKARQATDLSNMRAAYAAAEYAYLLDEQPLSGYYDAASGQLTDSVPAGYGQSTQDDKSWIANYSAGPVNQDNVSGTPNADGKGGVVKATVSEEGQVSLLWYFGVGSLYKAAASSWSSLKPSELKELDNNTERQEADLDGLQKLADTFINMDADTINALYGNDAASKFTDKNGQRLMAYYVDPNSGDIRVTGFNVQETLKTLGYP